MKYFDWGFMSYEEEDGKFFKQDRSESPDPYDWEPRAQISKEEFEMAYAEAQAERAEAKARAEERDRLEKEAEAKAQAESEALLHDKTVLKTFDICFKTWNGVVFRYDVDAYTEHHAEEKAWELLKKDTSHWKDKEAYLVSDIKIYGFEKA